MSDDELLARIDGLLRPLGVIPGVGEEYRAPALDILRYYARGVRLSRMPLLGRALSVVSVARQPPDLALDAAGGPRLIDRLRARSRDAIPRGAVPGVWPWA